MGDLSRRRSQARNVRLPDHARPVTAGGGVRKIADDPIFRMLAAAGLIYCTVWLVGGHRPTEGAKEGFIAGWLVAWFLTKKGE